MAMKMVEMALEQLKTPGNETLCPERIFVTSYNPRHLESMRLALVKVQKPKDKVRLYQAPEVLVGQPESAKSLSWTVGIIIDKLFHGRLFY